MATVTNTTTTTTTTDPVSDFEEAENKILADGFVREKDYERTAEDGVTKFYQRRYVKLSSSEKSGGGSEPRRILQETWLNVPASGTTTTTTEGASE